MATKEDIANEQWIAEQQTNIDLGIKMVKDASDEALEYVTMAIENMADKQWRKTVMSTQSVEMGIGIGIADNLVPVIYKDMEKKLHKQIGVTKSIATSLRHIYIGRVIKNVRKAINEHNQ